MNASVQKSIKAMFDAASKAPAYRKPAPDAQLVRLGELMNKARAVYQRARKAEAEANAVKCELYDLMQDIEEISLHRHNQVENPPKDERDEHEAGGFGA